MAKKFRICEGQQDTCCCTVYSAAVLAYLQRNPGVLDYFITHQKTQTLQQTAFKDLTLRIPRVFTDALNFAKNLRSGGVSHKTQAASQFIDTLIQRSAIKAYSIEEPKVTSESFVNDITDQGAHASAAEVLLRGHEFMQGVPPITLDEVDIDYESLVEGNFYQFINNIIKAIKNDKFIQVTIDNHTTGFGITNKRYWHFDSIHGMLTVYDTQHEFKRELRRKLSNFKNHADVIDTLRGTEIKIFKNRLQFCESEASAILQELDVLYEQIPTDDLADYADRVVDLLNNFNEIKSVLQQNPDYSVVCHDHPWALRPLPQPVSECVQGIVNSLNADGVLSDDRSSLVEFLKSAKLFIDYTSNPSSGPKKAQEELTAHREKLKTLALKQERAAVGATMITVRTSPVGQPAPAHETMKIGANFQARSTSSAPLAPPAPVVASAAPPVSMTQDDYVNVTLPQDSTEKLRILRSFIGKQVAFHDGYKTLREGVLLWYADGDLTICAGREQYFTRVEDVNSFSYKPGRNSPNNGHSP